MGFLLLNLTHPDYSLSYHGNPGRTLGQSLEGHAQSTHCFPHHRDGVRDLRKTFPPLFFSFLMGLNFPSHPHRKFPNLLNQNFQCERSNTIWCSDITCIPQRRCGDLATIARLQVEEVDERLSPALTIAPLQSSKKKKTILRPPPSLRSGIAVGNPLYQGILKQYGFLDKLVGRAIAMRALAWNHSLRP